MASTTRDYSLSLTLSVVGHGALIAILGLRLISLPAPKVPQIPLAIEATVIDTSVIRRQQEAERQAELEQQRRAAEAEREQQRRAAEAERERQAELQRQEAARERERQAKLEAERKAEAQRVAEEQRRAEEQRKAEEQRRIAEQKRREEAEQQRREAELQAQFQRELELEERRLAAVASGAQAQYIALIHDRVKRNWVQPASARAGIECVVHVTQIPGGTVVSARVGQCNGDASVVRSIVAAVEKSSPLPMPSDPTLFERNIRFTFKPQE